MNKLVVAALGWPASQAGCARALSDLPASAKLLPLVRSPAQEVFVAFVEALRSADPHAPTRCTGWTVHELTAHLTAGSAEIADLIELELTEARSRPTRGFEEREIPYRALSPKVLRRNFFREALRATVAVERLSKAGPSRKVVFTGSSLDAKALMLHIESELVLHRWDIVGSDAVAIAALSDPRMGVHAANTVAAMQPNVFPPRSGAAETVILRSPGAPDIAVTGGAATAVALAPDDGGYPVLQCHPAVRTLLLWGRTPEPGLPRPTGDPELVAAVQAMLLPDDSR